MKDRLFREKSWHNTRFKNDNRIEIFQGVYSIFKCAAELLDEYICRYAKPNANVLEYGCGAGGDLGKFYDIGVNYFAIDISEVAVESARNNCTVENYVKNISVQDAECTKFENDFFDLVFGSGILHHLDTKNAVSEIRRILKPSGTAVFLEPLGHNFFINLFRYLTPSHRTVDEHPLKVDDLELFSRTFGNVDVDYFFMTALFAIPFYNKSFFESVLSVLNRFDRVLFKHFPFLRRYAWVVVLQFNKSSTYPCP